MHLRIVKARSGKSFRKYAQLVQSYRRDDGMPAQKVVASLGQLSDPEIHNLRIALRASRNGKAVVLSGPEKDSWSSRILANLEYLDIAVAHQVWQGWKLTELLHRFIPDRSSLVSASQIIEALTIQRCVSPGSKLSAQRWFPRTALPELLDIDPALFNNSRLHRVLEQLDEIDDDLQKALPNRYEQKDGAFATLFIDVSDAWFEGRGCDLAERARTKEGLRNRYKVGILLLCNERGYPLRWKVLSGRARDPESLAAVVDEMESIRWAQKVPIIFDRAMGTAGSVGRLVDSGLYFLTAVRRSEISSYTDQIPTQTLDDINGTEDEDEQQRLEIEAARRMSRAGMTKVDERLFVLDLGVGERQLPASDSSLNIEGLELDRDELEGGAMWLWQARLYQQQLDDKVFTTRAQIAKSLGVTRTWITHVMNHLRLDEKLQLDVLSGSFGFIPERKLRAIAKLSSKAQQRRALEEHAVTARPMDGSNQIPKSRRTRKHKVSLRLVAYFNPQMFIEQRTRAQKHLRKIREHAADLNRQLLRERARRTTESIQIEMVNKLATLSLLSVFEVEIVEVPHSGEKNSNHLEVRLHFHEETWIRRRRYDGFVLLVSHSDLAHSVVELVQLYRDKDAVEKDFQTIKSDLKLRPVFHHTDPKVRAHVTLCMLALLLERTLENRLRRSAHPMTAPACFEELAIGRLNMLKSDPDIQASYVITEPNEQQRQILRSLRMLHLSDQQEVANSLHPRPTA